MRTLRDAARSVKPYLACCAALVLTACQPTRIIEVPVCPPLPASLTRDCGRCLPDDPTPVTNGELAEAWMDCRQCVAEYRIRAEAVRELAGCRAAVPAIQSPSPAP